MRSNVNVAIEPKVYHNEIKINDFCWSKNKNLKKKKWTQQKQRKQNPTKSYDSLLFHELDFFQNSPKRNWNQYLTLSKLNTQRINKDIYFSYSVVTHNSLIRYINKHFTLFVCNSSD